MEEIIDFLNKLNELCERHPYCSRCPLRSFDNGKNLKCFNFLRKYPEEAVKIILGDKHNEYR